MSDSAKRNILFRLTGSVGSKDNFATEKMRDIPILRFEDRLQQMKIMMEKVQTQLFITEPVNLSRMLANFLIKKNIHNLLYATGNKKIDEVISLPNKRNPGIKCGVFEKDIECFKGSLFNYDAAITDAYAGIAETGTLVLCPDNEEPRLISMIPPIHITLLSESKIVNSFQELIMKKGWREKMPANILLISGPSKTADIQNIIQYGAHGPKELIVSIIRGQ